MSFVATAIIGGAVIGGGATYLASQNAASAQEQAASNATNAQMSMFNTTQANLQPFIQAGKSQLPALSAWNDPTNPNSPLAALLKLTQPGANMNSTLAQLPGYQFAQSAANNALAARGLAGSGGPAANAAGTVAQQFWSNDIQNLLGTYQAGGGAMQNIANLGGNAAAGLGNAATTTGGQIGSNIIGAGNAAAGANIAAGNAVSNVGSSLGTAALLSQLMGNGSNSGVYNLGTISGNDPLVTNVA